MHYYGLQKLLLHSIYYINKYINQVCWDPSVLWNWHYLIINDKVAISFWTEEACEHVTSHWKKTVASYEGVVSGGASCFCVTVPDSKVHGASMGPGGPQTCSLGYWHGGGGGGGTIFLTWVKFKPIIDKQLNPLKSLGGITYPFINFNAATDAVWKWISDFIPHFTGHLNTY